MRVLVAELWAIMVIGDGVVGALFPAQHTARWAQAPLPLPWREFLQRLSEHPGLMRALSVAQAAGGVAIVASLPTKIR